MNLCITKLYSIAFNKSLIIFKEAPHERLLSHHLLSVGYNHWLLDTHSHGGEAPSVSLSVAEG